MSAALDWLPIDDGARGGHSVLIRAGNKMALGRWNGAAWVYPATGSVPVDFDPVAYYDPAQNVRGAYA